jgi:ribonuclease D
VAAQLLGYKSFGLAALLEQHFGIKLDKKFQRADWSLRPLSDGMLQYAAQDTMSLLGLRDILDAELAATGRQAWAAEEFLRLEQTQWAPEEPGDAFLRVKGARDLNRRELAVLRELVPWRDALARALDRSTFRVMGNEVLLELSRAMPTNKTELGATKGMPRSILEQRAEEMLDAVARGRAVPEAQLPRFPRSPRFEKDPSVDARAASLKAIRDAKATALGLDPGVLCSRERLETIARRQPRTLDELLETPDLRRWQANVLGDEVFTVLHGAEPSPYRDA